VGPRPAASYRAQPQSPYRAYRKPGQRALARGIDLAGSALAGPWARRGAALDWGSLRKVAVLRLDHLGDVVHALPALQALRLALPKAELTLVCGPWAVELAALSPAPHRVMSFDAPWFHRPRREGWPWGAIAGLGRLLKAQGFDAAFELRGEPRHLLALGLSGIPFRAGQALGPGGFLLHARARFIEGAHEQAQNLGTLLQAGLPWPKASRPLDAASLLAAAPLPKLRIPARGLAEARALAKGLKLKPRPLALQVTCGTSAKRWPEESWVRLINSLPTGLAPVILGGPGEEGQALALAARCRRKPAVAAGRLSLPGLAALLSSCRALVSLDSGPAHLAAGLGTPTLVLWSGTNEAWQWAPRGKRVRLVQAAPPDCSPCELADCPLGHACMAGLAVEDALASLKALLAGKPVTKED
jgi:ADP-heptose:LPS heptosyltransferase